MEIRPDELSERLRAETEGPLVVDIRNEDEYEDWHIPGSENVPVYDDLKSGTDDVADKLAAVPEDREIVTVCAAGVLSQEATTLLREMGYDAKTLVDGMNGWSRVHEYSAVDAAIQGTLVQVARPGKGCLSYVLVSDGRAAVFDPSQYTEEYETLLNEHDAELVGVFDTHAHADHVSGGRLLADRHDVPYHLHPADAENVDATPVADDETVAVGSVAVTVRHTPGHSPGGVTYDIDGTVLLTGDTLFHESVGRVELGVEAGIEDTDVEANAETLYESLQSLTARDGDPLVLPAHDPGSPHPPVAARLSDVVEHNGDLQRDREPFVERLANDVPDHPPNFERVKAVNSGLETVDEDEATDLEIGPNRCAAE